MDEQRKLLRKKLEGKIIKIPDSMRFTSHIMLRREAIAGLDGIHRKMNKLNKAMMNDMADAMAYAFAMFSQPQWCIIIEEEF